MKVAAFTITRDEPLFLRVWLNYHCQSFPQEDVYVIDNSTIDGSVEEAKALYPRVNFRFVPHAVSHVAMFLKKTVEDFQRELLVDKNYEAVVFSETDEYLIPSTKYRDIHDYCGQFLGTGKRWVRAEGWNVVHQIDTEPALDRSPGSRILEHRGSMWRIPIYSKTLITRVPLTYQKGFHLIYENGQKLVNDPVDEDLAMFHAWRIDVDEYYRRHAHRLGVDRETIETYFRTHKLPSNCMMDPHAVGPETPVPDHWKPLLYV